MTTVLLSSFRSLKKIIFNLSQGALEIQIINWIKSPEGEMEFLKLSLCGESFERAIYFWGDSRKIFASNYLPDSANTNVLSMFLAESVSVRLDKEGNILSLS
ncbi:hypothetical protein HYW53_02430 [Candidatus Giovannonibacteria bacterium]|nr:hypothetical protein [Candidatus Giovannonibacteria bacterium]